jgi:hypothetical protein
MSAILVFLGVPTGRNLLGSVAVGIRRVYGEAECWPNLFES